MGFGTVCVRLMIIIGIGIGISRLSSLNDGTSLIVNDRWPKIQVAFEILGRSVRSQREATRPGGFFFYRTKIGR
jgi:hypothetical protein